jgi:transposase
VEQITRGGVQREVQGEVVRVGVDLAKRVIQVHGVDAGGRVVAGRALARDKFMPWCAQLPAGCIVAMETSSSAHHWARRLEALGLEARIIAAQLVSPYRKQGAGGKNDANDAAAICEAASRPQMHFVPVKSVEQQSMLCVHRLREAFKAERTGCINRIRGLLGEFGLVFAQSPGALQAVLDDVLEDGANEMNTLAARARRPHRLVRPAHRRAREGQRRGEQGGHADGHRPRHGLGRGGHGGRVQAVQAWRTVRRLDRPGAAPALQRRQEPPGRHLPKRGDTYLRSLLIQGAKSAVMTAHKRSDPISQWAVALRQRVGWQKAAVALANKNARILWAVMTKGEAFDAHHLSVKPNAPSPVAASS